MLKNTVSFPYYIHFRSWIPMFQVTLNREKRSPSLPEGGTALLVDEILRRVQLKRLFSI